MSARKPKPKPRGGAREGAGRPTADGAINMTRRTVMLDSETYERLLTLGGGNISLGIRMAVRRRP